ncbi:aminotransferase class V-fold PLP-dependent enzyme [Gemmatimonas aurantiaca]|nr:aminotransferase class V-fold PLP-dependent enzyme [Gemmatimonas aurantiaca]
MKELLSYRDQFDSVKHCKYLISNSLGAAPNGLRDDALRYYEHWSTRGVRNWSENWWTLPREVGDKIGALIGAQSDTISMHANVTSASAVVQSCLTPTKERDKVVMVEMEFPSILYSYSRWLEGYEDRGALQIVDCPDGISVPLDLLLDAIDERTLVVPISHVLFRSAYIVDVKRIIEKAHSVGAVVVLDVFQSIGVVPIDLSELNVDFAVGGMLKWMCGGPGACFLYVRPDLQEKLEPRFTGWLAHENPFAFETGPMRYTSGSYRFQSGTPVIPALYTCQAGLDIVSEIGVERIRERSIEMTERIITLADERGWPIMAERDSAKRAGTVALNIPDGAALSVELNARDFLVDYRPQAGVRIAPHFYNTDDELSELFAEMDTIIADGSHKKRANESRIVT